jgi:hypothetical protein
MNASSSSTRRRLEIAFRRVRAEAAVDGSKEISIASVARIAGVSNSTIHNRYPDIAAHIRALKSVSGREQPKLMLDTSDSYQRKLTKAQEKIEQLSTDLRKTLSINLRLTRENEQLTARLKKASQ